MFRRYGRTLVQAAILHAAIASPRTTVAQEHPAKRLGSIVSVAVEEYGKAVDPYGKLISADEYQEATEFLADARGVAAKLSGTDAAVARAVLDTLIAAVAAKRPPQALALIERRFVAALGREGQLDLPRRMPDIAEGRSLFARNCASCHGALGAGEGPAAAGMKPAPPAIGTAAAMRDVSPALAYRIISVGVSGTPMAAWAGALTPEQRWSLVAYLGTLRAGQGEVRQGEGLFLQRCAACHGAAGAGDATLAAALSALPPEIGTFAWQAERSDAQIARAVREGVAGTAMPAAGDLSDPELAGLVAYVRALPFRQPGAFAADTTTADAAEAGARVLSLLDRALTSARGGRSSEAGDRAFDAYLAFEPLETPARAKNPGLVSAMERRFAEFKAAVKRGDVDAAAGTRNAIAAGLPQVVELTRTTSSACGAFLESFLIIVREGFEAILVIGAVVAFLLKTGHRERLRSIWTGAVLGLVASGATAVVLATLLSAMPASREIIEGGTMLVAVVILFSVSYWLISKVEAAKWQQFIREKVTRALEGGGGRALALVAFLAVYREGAETALFYQALFAQGPHVGVPLSLGIAAGFVALAVVFTLFYRFGVRIPMRPFFTVTSGLLYYMAFVFAGKGIRELQEGNVLPITVIPGVPHVDAMGIFPTVETLLAQLLLIVLFVFALAKTFWPRRSVALPTVSSAAPDLDARLARLEQTIAGLARRVEAMEGAAPADGHAGDELPRDAGEASGVGGR